MLQACCHTFTAESAKELKMVPTRSATPGVRIKLLWLGMAVPTICWWAMQVSKTDAFRSTSLCSLIHDWKITKLPRSYGVFALHHVTSILSLYLYSITWPHQKTSLMSQSVMNHLWLPCDVELDHIGSYEIINKLILYWNTNTSQE